MKHNEAVQTVASLAPQIEKRGAAEVLLEYATREDLPPAQLEKLAQVYNTLLTVSHIDNAAEDARGATIPLLDVPELVVGYATGIGREKAAAGPHSFSSHDVRTLDLNLAIKRTLDPGMSKAASQVTTTPDQADERLGRVMDMSRAQDALLDVELDLRMEMSKLASELFAAAPHVDGNQFLRDISEYEIEALQHQPVCAVKAAGAFMEKFAAPHHTKLQRFAYDYEVTPYAYDIDHRLGKTFAELAKTAGTLDMIVKMSAETLQEVERNHKSPDNNAAIPPMTVREGSGAAAPQVEVSPSMLASLLSGARIQTQRPEPEPSDDEKPRNEDDLLGEAETLITSTSDKPSTSTGSAPRAESRSDNTQAPSSAPKAKSKVDLTGDAKPSSGFTKDDMLELLSRPVNAVSDTIRGAAGKMDETISHITSKERTNKAQQSADISVEDIKRAMGVRRLIGTDPVLKEADPKVVLEVYNSVVARNPQLAGDMAALRLVLREAVSYEGLTLDSQKLLTEIRRNTGEADKTERENTRQQYAVGGAQPLPITKL